MLNKLILKNFKLFKNQELAFDRINIIKGINYDVQDQSSNGSGKSSILEGIIFALYGEGSGKNLQDLISFEKKETIVEIQNEDIKVIRKIPTDLHIFRNEQEMQFNTNTLRQNALNNVIGSYDFFKKYRLINKQAVNLLDLGLISLRKELMTFINADFSQIRQSLLSQKLERETYNKDKRLYKFYLSTKRLSLLESGLINRQDIYKEQCSGISEQNKIVNNIKSEVQALEKEVYYKQNEIAKAKEGICPILKTKCEKISKSLNEKDNQRNLEVSKEINQLTYKIEQLKEILESEQDYLRNLESNNNRYSEKIQRTKSYIMKLKEAFKFLEYKYTLKDIELYTSSIRVLDDFSGWFIQRWLDNLAIVINDLLSKVNLSIVFSSDKQFLTITEEGRTMKYENLSSGQQCFLNCIFKIAILLNNGVIDGLLLFDEGINVLDKINLKKLINILQDLNFQTFLIYQNYDLEEDVHLIEITRKNNESKIK